jgi:hypothetical protein
MTHTTMKTPKLTNEQKAALVRWYLHEVLPRVRRARKARAA